VAAPVAAQVPQVADLWDVAELRLDLGLTCAVFTGLEGEVSKETRDILTALAIGIRPPPDTQILNKDVKNRVKKQRLIVREAFQTALSASLPEGGEKDDLKALRASSELCARLRQAVACLGDSDAVAETLKAGFLGGFDPNTVTLAPVAVVKEVEQREVEPIVGKKAGKKGKAAEKEPEDLDSLLAEFGVQNSEKKKGKAKTGSKK